MTGFVEKLEASIRRNDSLLCVGLDPTLDTLPEGVERSPAGLLRFNQAVIETTADLACAYKPNVAFYEALGEEGWHVLRETVRSVPSGIPIIADAKRGDVESTAAAYAEAIFDHLGCDACTLSPYLGRDAVAPFIDRPGRFAFVLCRTSNPSASQVQDLLVDGEPLYVHIARQICSWGLPTSVGLVVGATDPDGARQAAGAAPDRWLLAPGLGAQGGDLAATASALGPGAARTLWTVSRGVTRADSSPAYAEGARKAAMVLRDAVNAVVIRDAVHA